MLGRVGVSWVCTGDPGPSAEQLKFRYLGAGSAGLVHPEAALGDRVASASCMTVTMGIFSPSVQASERCCRALPQCWGCWLLLAVMSVIRNSISYPRKCSGQSVHNSGQKLWFQLIDVFLLKNSFVRK